MHAVRLDTLDLSVPLAHPLYHEGGALVFQRGVLLTVGDVIALHKLRVGELAECRDEAEYERLLERARKEDLPLSRLTTSHVIATPVYTENGELIVDADVTVNQALIEELRKFRVTKVAVRKEPGELEPLKKFIATHRARPSLENSRGAGLPADRFISGEEELDEDHLVARVQAGAAHCPPEGRPLSDDVLQDAALSRNEDVKRYYLKRYEQHFERTMEFFDQLRATRNGSKVDTKSVGNIARDIIECLVRDKDLLLCMHHFKRRNYYLVAHTLNVTLVSINIAVSQGYSRPQVLEVAYGAFLHDVGMLRIPAEIEEKTDPLTSAERAEIERHPIYGLDVLRSLERVPRSTPFIVYQEHERADGTGYPRGCRGDQIHPYARIVAMADCFDAMTTDRPYHKAVKPYTAIEAVIREAHAGRFDRDMVKAFLRYFSLFPVGSWVRLNTQEIASVVASNPTNYDKPVVRVVFRNDDREIYATPRLEDLSRSRNLHVVSAVDAPQDLSEGMFWMLNLL